MKEPIRTTIWGAATITTIVTVILNTTGLHLSAGIISMIVGIVGVVGPLAAAEIARLKVTPTVNEPTNLMRN